MKQKLWRTAIAMSLAASLIIATAQVALATCTTGRASQSLYTYGQGLKGSNPGVNYNTFDGYPSVDPGGVTVTAGSSANMFLHMDNNDLGSAQVGWVTTNGVNWNPTYFATNANGFVQVNLVDTSVSYTGGQLLNAHVEIYLYLYQTNILASLYSDYTTGKRKDVEVNWWGKVTDVYFATHNLKDEFLGRSTVPNSAKWSALHYATQYGGAAWSANSLITNNTNVVALFSNVSAYDLAC